MRLFTSIYLLLKCQALIACMLLLAQTCASQNLYKAKDLNISFVSEAPLEFIKANSIQGQGVLNTASGEFVFKVAINSFHGFNNKLQRVHFMENYMEWTTYKEATFKGHLIETLDLSASLQKVRAKGLMEIHGVSNEIMINVNLKNQETTLEIDANFTVDLEDYKIKVPTIVRQKIAETIRINVNGKLLP